LNRHPNCSNRTKFRRCISLYRRLWFYVKLWELWRVIWANLVVTLSTGCSFTLNANLNLGATWNS
jgi:hypothetical protein